MPRLTIIMPYFNNPMMLAKHYDEWASWPAELRNEFRFIVVDDCSSKPAGDLFTGRELAGLVSIYRVTKNKPWNQHGARNIGAHEAHDGWLLLTDIDHMLTRGNAISLVDRLPYLDPGVVFTFSRVESTTGKPTRNSQGFLKPHPNSFLMQRAKFWEIGGYDEDYCGIYGTDSLFRARCRPVTHLDIPLVRYWRDVVQDASTNDLPRKEGRDPKAKEKVLARKRAAGRADRISTFLLPWERVC